MPNFKARVTIYGYVVTQADTSEEAAQNLLGWTDEDIIRNFNVVSIESSDQNPQEMVP